jgi:hypothetical protein
MRRTLGYLLVLLLLAALPSPARAAATLTQVTGFGSNPGALRMYSYVPDGLPAGRPMIVALHGCTQSAADYYAHSGWPKYADAYSAALVLPEQTSANNGLVLPGHGLFVVPHRPVLGPRRRQHPDPDSHAHTHGRALLHRQQLRAHHGRPGVPELRPGLRQRLGPVDGPVEPRHPAHAAPHRRELLRPGRRPVLSVSPAGMAAPDRAPPPGP